MDHAVDSNLSLFLILVDAFSGWPEVIGVANCNAETVKKVLKVVFARLGVPYTLVADNAKEFHDEAPCL